MSVKIYSQNEDYYASAEKNLPHIETTQFFSKEARIILYFQDNLQNKKTYEKRRSFPLPYEECGRFYDHFRDEKNIHETFTSDFSYIFYKIKVR